MLAVALAASALPALDALQAQELETAVREQRQVDEDAARSQGRVDDLASQTDRMLSEYRSVVREIESLRSYNDNLEQIVANQQAEVESIHRQLDGLEATNRDVVPLMFDMIDTLERVVEADIPFRLPERRARVERLRAMMDQADVSASEKYRRVLEAYRSELEFGRTTEAYSDTLPTSGQTVDFLRVGRTLLVYQTGDAAETGWFNPSTRSFERLPEHYRLDVKRGLAIARNSAAPDLVILPVPGPEVAE